MADTADGIARMFATGGATGALLAERDWSRHSLGRPGEWGQSLRSALSLCLHTRFPSALFWGPEHILLYNDAFVPNLGSRHPTALGEPAREVWPELWDRLGPRLEQVLVQGESVTAESELQFLTRNGYREECYFDYSLSPVRGERDEIAGIFNPCVEVTRRVLGERRARVLHGIASSTALARSAEQACVVATETLGLASGDVRFCITYLLTGQGHRASLTACSGATPGSATCPVEVTLEATETTAPWPLATVLRTRTALVVTDLDLADTTGSVADPWREPTRAAITVPICTPGCHTLMGFLVLGLSPRRPIDEDYRRFATHAAESIAAAIATAQLHQSERSALRTRLAQVASVAPAAIFELRVDAAGGVSIPYSTPAIEALYAHSPEDIARDASAAIALIHPDDRHRFERLISDPDAPTGSLKEEWRVLHPSRGEIWVELRATAQRVPEGGRIWYGYFHETTERKHLEHTLVEREARFRQLAENIQECFFLTDPVSGEMLYVSPAYESIWGRPRAALYTTPSAWLQGVHADDRARIAPAIDARRRGEAPHLEYRVVRPDGSVRIVHDRVFPIRDASGQVQRIAGIAEDVTAQRQRERQIRFLAYHDALTRLPNRALLANRLTQAIARTQRSGEALALMMLDVDRFKTVNDSLGHPAGDALLQQIAHRLTETLRAGDTVARAGGDEFLLLIPGLHTAEEAAPVAEHVLACLTAPFVVQGSTLHITGSVGISISPRDATDVPSLIKYADSALYLAKEQGRNTFRFFSPELDARVRDRIRTERDLRTAIVEGQFALYYQPQLDLATGRLTGAEALLRWNHPERGLVQPAEFISIAEETGLILPIGEWALREACGQARALHEAGRGDVRLFVNISGRQLADPDIVPTVRRILEETSCRPEQLGLEITESSVMDDPGEASSVIAALHALGLEIAIDDFGTGYSSMAYLKRFALDRLKIDAQFIQGIPQDDNDRAIVQATIALARQFRLKVTAEGVETAAQQSFLEANDCDAVQGYLIGEPRPGEAMRKLL